jgi:hypothetical protein
MVRQRQLPSASKVGLNRLLGVAGSSVGSGAAGLITGVFESGLVPGVGGWLPGGWGLPVTIALGSAAIGAVAGVLMSWSASRQGTFD